MGMSAALKLDCEEFDVPREPKCVTTAKALWARLLELRDREQLALAVCVETSTTRSPGRRRRRRPTQERIVIAFRSGGKVRVFDPGASAGPLRELTGAQDLAGYFDEAAGFSYVVVR
jgi:hypothetical protein